MSTPCLINWLIGISRQRTLANGNLNGNKHCPITSLWRFANRAPAGEFAGINCLNMLLTGQDNVHDLFDNETQYAQISNAPIADGLSGKITSIPRPGYRLLQENQHE